MRLGRPWPPFEAASSRLPGEAFRGLEEKQSRSCCFPPDPLLYSTVASPAEQQERPVPSGVFTGPPIFISGCNRGGTTILSQILACHPEVRNIGRSQFNEGQYIWRRRWPDLSRHRWALPPWRWYLRRDERSATPETLRFFREAFEAAMPSPGRMLEKTPANAVRIPFINYLYPDCRFVHVIRDGRDTTASLIARRVSPLFAPHQWVQAHRTALPDLQRIPGERVVLVRYEKLMAEPEVVLEQICLECGLRWDEEAAAAVVGEARGSLREVDRRWQRLPAVLRRYALRVIGELQQELGYPTDA